MKKVFASDFDGTLYFYNAKVKLPPESVRKIKEYQSAGNLFGLCTGRQVGGLTPFITGLIEPDFYITSSGANILDKNFNEIARYGIERTAAGNIVRNLDPKKFPITLDIEGDIYVFSKMDYPGKYFIIADVEEAPAGLIHQISVQTESFEAAADIAERVNRMYGSFVEAFQNVSNVDIAPKGCSKGKGIRTLRNHLLKSIGECVLYGIGDSINDLPLLKEADISYTFPYAPEDLQRKATKIVDNICAALEDSMA